MIVLSSTLFLSLCGLDIGGQYNLHTGEKTSLDQLEPEMHIPLEGFSPNLVVWDMSVTIREKDWHVRIQGESNAFSIGGYTFEEQDQLAKKGSLTTGSIVAVHYEQTGEFYVRLSRNLDRDMLIALDAQAQTQWLQNICKNLWQLSTALHLLGE